MPPTPWGRLVTSLRGAGPTQAPDDLARMSDDEKRKYISTADPTERNVGRVAVVLGIAVTLIWVLPYMLTKKYDVTASIKPKGKTCPPVAPHIKYTTVSGKGVCEAIFPPSHYVWFLVLPIVFAALIVVALYLKRRTWLAFAILLLGLALSTESIIATLPFLLAGGWIMLRAYRTQKYGAPNQKAVQPGWTAPARPTSRRARATGPSRPTSSGKSGTKTPSRKAPSANKRYTPRTPPKPVKKTATR